MHVTDVYGLWRSVAVTGWTRDAAGVSSMFLARDIPLHNPAALIPASVAWLRPGSVWVPTLRSKLENEPFVGLALMVSTLDSSLPLQLHAVLQPTALPELHQAFDRIAKLLTIKDEPEGSPR